MDRGHNQVHTVLLAWIEAPIMTIKIPNWKYIHAGSLPHLNDNVSPLASAISNSISWHIGAKNVSPLAPLFWVWYATPTPRNSVESGYGVARYPVQWVRAILGNFIRQLTQAARWSQLTSLSSELHI